MSGAGVRETLDTGALHSTAAATVSAAAHTVEALLLTVPAAASAAAELTCGYGDRAPISTVVPALVRDICMRYRRGLPQIGWARACWVFADFLRMLRPCPAGGAGADVPSQTATGGAADCQCQDGTCSRCAVMHALLGALHACFTEAISVSLRRPPAHVPSHACAMETCAYAFRHSRARLSMAVWLESLRRDG